MNVFHVPTTGRRDFTFAHSWTAPPASTSPCFHDEEAAHAYVEARLWGDAPVCPHCGSVGRSGRMCGATTRIGAYKCYTCRKPFTVKVGTPLEGSHVPLHRWLQALHLVAQSRPVIGSTDLHRVLGVTLKTAASMARRIGGPDPASGEEGDGRPARRLRLAATRAGRNPAVPQDGEGGPDERADRSAEPGSACRRQSAVYLAAVADHRCGEPDERFDEAFRRFLSAG
nr:transposase [Chthonobacter rhizosphaerae]